MRFLIMIIEEKTAARSITCCAANQVTYLVLSNLITCTCHNQYNIYSEFLLTIRAVIEKGAVFKVNLEELISSLNSSILLMLQINRLNTHIIHHQRNE